MLLDFVLNRHGDFRKTFKLRKPEFAKPEQNVDALFDHSHSLFTEAKPKIPQTPVDLDKLEWNCVKLPGITFQGKLQFPKAVQAKKRLQLDNLRQFSVTANEATTSTSHKVNLLTEIKDDTLSDQDKSNAQSQQDKKLADEFLRKNLKSPDTDFGTLVKQHGSQMGKGNYKWAHLVNIIILLLNKGYLIRGKQPHRYYGLLRFRLILNTNYIINSHPGPLRQGVCHQPAGHGAETGLSTGHVPGTGHPLPVRSQERLCGRAHQQRQDGDRRIRSSPQ